MKCSACRAFECEGNYEFRNVCTGKKERMKCVCKCHVTALEYGLTNGCSIGGGLAMIIGGLGAIPTVGPTFAAAIVGGGIAMVNNSVTRMYVDEHMEIGGLVYDVAIGGVIGGVYGAMTVTNPQIMNTAQQIVGAFPNIVTTAQQFVAAIPQIVAATATPQIVAATATPQIVAATATPEVIAATIFIGTATSVIVTDRFSKNFSSKEKPY